MPTKPPRILAIVGPTASGKTSLALSLAEHVDMEIVSADSRQIFRYLDIGTAKPTVLERRRVKHHFVDVLYPDEEYSAGQYGLAARNTIAAILDRKKLPVIVGGSGLYIKAALDGLFDGPGKDPEIRSQLEGRLKTEGLAVLLKELKEVDPLTVKRMKEITPRRIIRALEVYQITGRPLSLVQAEENAPAEFEAYQIGLLWDRKELYQRINQRVDEMIAAGLEGEVDDLITRGYSRRVNALNTVGYKEVFDHREGLHSHEEMIELIKRNSRRFAKRQMTWFRNDQRIHWKSVSGDDWLKGVEREILRVVRERSVSGMK